MRYKQPMEVWGDRAVDVFRWRLLQRARDKRNGNDLVLALNEVPIDERGQWSAYVENAVRDGSGSDEDDDDDDDAADNAASVDTLNFVRVRADADFDEVCVYYTKPLPLYTTSSGTTCTSRTSRKT